MHNIHSNNYNLIAMDYKEWRKADNDDYYNDFNYDDDTDDDDGVDGDDIDMHLIIMSPAHLWSRRLWHQINVNMDLYSTLSWTHL